MTNFNKPSNYKSTLTNTSNQLDVQPDNIIAFPASPRASGCSHQEVGHWVDRLLSLPESSNQATSLEKDSVSDLAELLVENGIV